MNRLTRARMERAISRSCKDCSKCPLDWKVRPEKIPTCMPSFLTDKQISLAYRLIYGHGGKRNETANKS